MIMRQIPDEYSKEDLVWIYDFEYTEAHDLQLYVECARRFGAPILELGCGTGRLSIPLAAEGFEVWGIEASTLMIEECRKKMKSHPGATLQIKIIEGDMADFDLGRAFPLIIVPINSFLILDQAGQQSCLECCYKHLAPDGALVIDVFNPFGPGRAFQYSGQVEGLRILVSTRPHPKTGRPVRRFVSQRRDFFNQMAHIKSEYEEETPDGPRMWTFTENLRFVYKSEMELMIEAAGMELYRIFGFYDGHEFSPSSEQMIFISRRKGAK